MKVDRLGQIEFGKNEMLSGYHESSSIRLVRPLPTAQLNETDEGFNKSVSRERIGASRNVHGLCLEPQ